LCCNEVTNLYDCGPMCTVVCSLPCGCVTIMRLRLLRSAVRTVFISVTFGCVLYVCDISCCSDLAAHPGASVYPGR
jgi:hypothetical protein